MGDRERVNADFDAIAALTPAREVPSPHERALLRHLPASRRDVLEIGCGTGHLARRLASSFERVVALDRSAGMIEEARRRTRAPNVEYVCADLFEWLGGHQYDCIISVATLHHMPTSAALEAMTAALRPGGRLLVLDIWERSGWRHFPVNALAWVVARLRELFVSGRMSPELREAWAEHGRHETYLTVAEARRLAPPGARVRGHLLWRYSLVWENGPTFHPCSTPASHSGSSRAC